MSVRPGSRRDAFRLALLLGSVSAATLSSSVPAIAQTAPNPLATPVLAAGGSGGAAISIDAAAGQAKIDVAGSNRLVQWDSFNVGANATVAFADTSGAAGHLAVLNSVNAANGLSQIYGRITADPKISVWLANPSGVLFGGSGGFSGGSLVLTTAQIGAADQARFDRTAPDSLTGTIQLAGMTADATKGVTLGPQTNLAVTGGVVIAGQVVKVQGTIAASGDVALVAAETATVPLDLGSPIAVTINRGATVGSATLGAGGTITAANITLGAAAASGYDMLLSVDSGAALTATAASGGRVVIAAGRTSGETGGNGTPAVSLTPIANGDTGGAARLTSAGALTATGRAWLGASGDVAVGAGSITTQEGSANALTLDAFGNLAVAADLIAAHGAIALTAGFGGSFSGRIDSGSASNDPGAIAISAYSGLTFGRTNGATQIIQTTGNVALRTSMGLITAPGATQITAGRLGGSNADIAVRQGVTADLALGGATLVAGTDASGTANHLGTVTLQTSGTTIQPTGNITVQAIDAGTLILPLGGGSQLTGTFTADHVMTQAPLVIRSTAGSLRIDQATSLTGGVSLTSDTGDVSGTAVALVGDGRLLDGYGRLGITDSTGGTAVSVTAAGTAKLGTVTAAGGGIGVSAAAIDVASVTSGGALSLTASGRQLSLGTGVTQGITTLTKRGTVGELSVGNLITGAATTLISDTAIRVDQVGTAAGDLTVTARNGDITGRATANGFGRASISARNTLQATASGLALLDSAGGGADATITAASIDATTLSAGYVVGTAGGALSATATSGALTLGSASSRLAATVTKNGATGALTATSIIGGTSASVTSATAVRVDTIIANGRNADGSMPDLAVTASAGDLTGSRGGRAALSAQAGGAGLVATTSGTALLGAAQAGDAVSVTGMAIDVSSATAGTGALTLTANGGQLSLGTGAAGTAAMLAKSGATGDLSAGTLTAGTSASLVSDTSVRVDQAVANGRSTVATTADLLVDARHGDVTGRSGGRSDLTTTASGANLGVTATGTALLGTVVAANDLTVMAGAIDATTTTAGAGALSLAASGGALTLGSGSSGTASTLTKTGTTGEMSVGSLVAGTSASLTSATSVRVDTAIAQRGDLSIDAPGQVTGRSTGTPAAVGDGVRVASLVSAGAVGIDAAGNVRLGSAGSTDGAIGVAANGSVTGLAIGDVSANTGAALSAGGAIRIGSSSQRPTRIALGAVGAGSTLTLVGDAVSAAGLDAGGALTVQAGSGLSIDRVGAIASPTSATLVQAPIGAGTGQGGEDPAVVTMTSGTMLSPGYAAADLATAGAVSVQAGRATLAPGSAGIAQLGTVRGGSVSVVANALTVGTAVSTTDTLSLLARTGGLYAGPLTAATTATLAKMGATGDPSTDTQRNELRLTDALVAGRGVSVTSATGVRGTQITSVAGPITVAATTGSVTGLADTAAPTDGRLLAGYDRLSLTAGAPAATIGVTAAQTAQLGTVAAGASGGGTSATFNQVVLRATAIDVVTLQAANGNAALVAGTGGLRLGSGDAGASFALYNPGDGSYAPGLDSGADAQIGSARADTGDLLLRVPGALTGLLTPGTGYASAADGLAIGSLTSTGGVSVSGAGDVRLDTVSAGGAVTVGAGGSARIGDLVAGDAVAVTAALSVTGLPSASVPTNTGATLTAARDIRLPATGAPGEVAVLGSVSAGGNISLAATQLSAGSVSGGGVVTLAGGSGLSVGSVSGASAIASTASAGSIAADSGATTLDGAGLLRAGYGAANLRTTSSTAPVTVTARGGAAQLGAVVAAAGPLAGQQVAIVGQAVLVGTVTAPAASLAISAAAGDLVLGAGGATIGDSAQLTKTGTAGSMRLIGALTTGVGGLPAAVVPGSDVAPGSGGVLATSSTDLLGTSIASRTGDVRLRAVGRVGGLSGDGAAADGVRLVDGDATTAAVSSAGDLRIGQLTTTGDQNLSARGSITGLAGSTVPASLDVSAAKLVDVRSTSGATLGQATLRTVAAGTAVIAADRIAVRTLAVDGAATLSAGSGLAVDTLRSGAATLQATAATTTGVAFDYVADDTGIANEPLVAAAGAATLTSRAGGIGVAAGRAVQLGAVSAGGVLARGTRDSLDVTGHALTIASAVASGPMVLTATTGGLYLGTGTTSGTAALSKTGTVSPALDATANEVRVGALASTGDLAITSATGMRLGQVTSRAGSITLAATGGDITGLLRPASVAVPADDQALPAYEAANVTASAARQRVTVSASGQVKLGALSAGAADASMSGDQIMVAGTAIDVGTANAINGNLVLTSTTGRVRLSTGKAAGDVTLTAGAQAVTNPAIVADAQIGSLTAGGNLGVFATGNVSGLVAAGQAAPLASEGLRVATLSSGSATITAAGDARLGTIGVSGALALSAGRDATGLSTGDSGIAVPALGVATLTAGGNVTVGRPVGPMAGTQAQRLANAALGPVSAGGGVSVDAATLLAGSVTGSTVSLTAARALSVDGVTASGVAALSTDTAASAASSSVPYAADATLASGYQQSGALAGNLTAQTLTATIAGVAQLAQIKTIGGDLTLSAGAMSLGTLNSAGALSLTATAGGLYLESGTAAGAATLLKGTASGDPGADAAQNVVRVGTLVAGPSASVSSDTAIRIDSAMVAGRGSSSSGVDLTVTARGGDVSGRAVGTGYGRADLKTTGAGAGISVSATATALLGAVEAGRGVAVTAAAIDATRTVATSGALGLTATKGALLLGTGSSGSTSTLTKTGALDEMGVGALTAGTSASLVSDTSVRIDQATVNGRIALTTSSGPDLFVNAKAGDVSGRAGGRASLQAVADGASVGVAATRSAILGTVLAANNVTVSATSVDATSTTATAGALTLTASGGALTLGTGVSGLATSLAKSGTPGELSVGTLTAGTSASLVSDTSVRVDQATAKGRTTMANSPDLLVLARAGDVSGRAAGRAGLTASAAGANIGVTASRAATLGTAAAANNVTVSATSVDATSTTATAGALTLTASGGALTLGTGTAGLAVTLTKTGTSGGIGVGGVTGASVTGTSDTSLAASSATARAGDISLLANGGALSLGSGIASGGLALTAATDSLMLGTGTAGTTATLTKAGTAGKMAIAGTLSAPGAITLSTSTDLDLGGLVSSASILVDQTAGKGIALGFADSATTGDLRLTAPQVNLIAAPTVTFQARGGPVELGTVAFDSAGTTRLNILTTGAITVDGAVTGGGGTSRLLQLGGTVTTGEIAQDNTLPLAASLTGTLETGASITWGGSVDLRARQILFGNAVLRGTVAGQGGAAVATNFVSNPSSSLYYTASGSGRTFLTANRLTVRYGDYALFQNTGATSAINAGLKLGPDGNSTNTIALVLDGPGDNNANAFALFGTINGFVGRSAGLLPETVVDFATGTAPRVLRITQSNSRVNGCVIGSPDRGCLNIDTPPPTLRLFDERYLLLFDTNQDAEVSFDPLIATNNEALLGDLTTGSDPATTVGCAAGSTDPRCAAQGARKE